MYDRVLWGDLKTMFDPPLSDDAIWSLPLQQKIINWRYYPICVVHCLTLDASTIYMLADRKYPLSKDACQVMLKMKLLDGTMDEVCYQLLKMIEKQNYLKEQTLCKLKVKIYSVNRSNTVDACTTARAMWKRVEQDTFDGLFDYLQPFEKLVNASRARKFEKSHDPLALVAHTGLSSRNTSSYYVTHPLSVVDSDDEYQKDVVQTNSEDPLTSAMLVNIQSRNSGNTGRNTRRAYVQEEVNDFLFVDASRMEEIEELSANICLMARIQPANTTSDDGPSYDSAFVSEVQSSSIKDNQGQMYPTHTKIINSTIGDDQINSNIIFDEPNGNVNSGSVEDDTHVPDLYTLEQLARNAYQEAEKQQLFAQKADQRAKHLDQQAQTQFVPDRYIIRDLEKQRDKLDLAVIGYKRKNKELQKTHSILKRQMSDKEDSYHDTILDLEAKLKKNVDLLLKLGNSLQGMFMLGPKPLSVYDSNLKHGLGYPNPYTLKQAISQCLKLYSASSLNDSAIPLNVRDTADILDDASKSQNKMKEKMNDPIAVAKKHNCWSIDYKQINALYDNFVPQKELSAEQKYFSSSFISTDKTSNATPTIPVSMPSESPLLKELDKMKKCFQTLFKLLQKNCKRASIFYTSPEEIKLNEFCQDQVKPIVKELHFYFEFFKNHFQSDIKEMKDVFESTESELCETKKQNEFLKEQLLEASLKHEVEICVLLSHECADTSLHAKIEQIQRNSIEIQEGLQARIKILEKDKLKTENMSLDFKLQSLIRERDNVKLEYQKLLDSIKKTRSQSQKEMDELIDHVSEKTYAYGKSVNTKFDKTNVSHSLLCVTPINKQVFQKKIVVSKPEEKHVVSKPVTLQTSPEKQRGTNSNKNVIAPGMYKVVTKQESKTKETKCGFSSTGINVASSVRRSMNRESDVKKSVLANSKISAKKVEVYVRKNKQTDNESATVISNKENVIDVDVANAPKAKVVLCVSCMQNVLIPCHDKCLANFKLNVHLNVRRALFTNPRTPKSSDTTHVVSKTRFS
ncbi:hypothetical protein Tco_0842928 [Tanacetum coccineum]|uniref:Uncharacterized protein n=1 Tax=Tanacetum coccineum TaxID=301880 RepID=A0ABQ5B0M2_9ASTR